MQTWRRKILMPGSIVLCLFPTDIVREISDYAIGSGAAGINSELLSIHHPNSVEHCECVVVCGIILNELMRLVFACNQN
uniref:Uncharacterized protein n=1 Tax=Onchocerca volvulus TaxID=6282 RepID=A0A8R1TX19_ONCVO